MAALELVKAFEALRVYQPVTSIDDISKKKEPVLTKAEKVATCNSVADNICSISIRNAVEFPKFLGISIELLLRLCDDEEADVRIAADESLNRTIKTLLDTNLGRIQVELYKEIKRNGTSRSLRAALWRFADMAHLIRPQKCRPYVINLLPCLASVCQREEEAVQETLAGVVQKICPILATFATDTEAKALMKAFLINLSSGSASTRRAASRGLIAICLNVRKPATFTAALLSTLLDMILPVDGDQCVHSLLGALLCLRHVVTHLCVERDSTDTRLTGNIDAKLRDAEIEGTLHQLEQLYAALLHYCTNADHNVLTACLDTLLHLLRHLPPSLGALLATPGALPTPNVFAADLMSGVATAGVGGSLSQLPLPGDDAVLDDDLDIASEVGTSTSGSLSADDAATTTSLSGDTAETPPGDQNENRNAAVAAAAADAMYSSVEIGDVDDAMNEDTDDDVPMTLVTSVSADTLSDAVRTSGGDEGPDDDGASPVVPAAVDDDIGALTDVDTAPLLYGVRLLCARFLLADCPRGVMPDAAVRVSVKTLAVSCVTAVVTLQPALFLAPLHKSAPPDGQRIADLLLYSSHPDPQLRGVTAGCLGALVMAALSRSPRSFPGWVATLPPQYATEAPSLDELVSTLIGLLEDRTSVTARLALSALQTCLPSILGSVHLHVSLRLMRVLLRLKSFPYWLVKVKLLEVISEVNFKVVAFIETHSETLSDREEHFMGGEQIQRRTLDGIIGSLLVDQDSRVRHAAATCLVQLVPHLFFAADVAHATPTFAVAHDLTAARLDPVMHDWSVPSSPVHGPVAPYGGGGRSGATVAVGRSLSRIVARVTERLNSATSKHVLYGCIRALSQLAAAYPATRYGAAWGCVSPGGAGGGSPGPHSPEGTGQPGRSLSVGSGTSVSSVSSQLEMTACGGPLPLILDLLTSSPVTLHLAAHEDALRLAAQVFAGAAYKCLQNIEACSESQWAALGDRQLVDSAHQLFSHVARLLCIICHIMEDTTPGPPPSKTTLPSLPNAPSLSPIRRRAKGLRDEPPLSQTAGSSTSQATADKNSTKSTKDQTKDTEKEKGKKEGVGAFHRFPHYMRLYEVMKVTYDSYKISAELSSVTDRFSGMVRATLEAFSLLLEVAGLAETGQAAEELLGYLKATVGLCAPESILCVQQLLKSLFGTNLASQWEGEPEGGGGAGGGGGGRKPGSATRLVSSTRPGLYHACFTAPYSRFTQRLGGAATLRLPSSTAPDHDESSGLITWLKKKAERKMPNMLKGSKTDKTSVASYIRLFEPLVIRALKQYTVSSCLQLQTHVLQLLAQLVQLRVNYCLLDSDQIFLGFVIKQFEYIEEGQMRYADQLIPHIFHFFVLLSYERYHSKSVIAMPKIIQLCDGIMASGRDPATHAVPALQAIVQDLFVLRTAAKLDAGKEIATQREVVVSMIFRLLRYHQVLELLLLVLHECRRDNEEKWKRLSRQITDSVLPLLCKQQVNLDDRVSVDVVHRLFEAVAPSVFRPVDSLLLALFAVPPDLAGVRPTQRWLALVLVALRVLISQSTEDVVLLRLQELRPVVAVVRPDTDIIAPLLTPPQTLARFLFQVIGQVATKIDSMTATAAATSESANFLCQELSHLLLYTTHMFQSGNYRRVATVAMAMLREDDGQPTPACFYSVAEINERFVSLGAVEPTVALQWANVLTLLNYADRAWWARLMRTRTSHHRRLVSPSSASYDAATVFGDDGISCNMEIVRQGSLILFCDYVCENLNDADHTTAVIVDHVVDLVQLSHEPPVQDFISVVHQNSAASGLFIQAIHSTCEHFTKPGLVLRALRCLGAVPAAQGGALLVLLVDAFLATPHRCVATVADGLACLQLEALLAGPPRESMTRLPLEDLVKLLRFMEEKRLCRRHGRLVSLMLKLQSVFASQDVEGSTGIAELSSTDSVLLSVDTNVADVDKDWFVAFVAERCASEVASPRECARLLQALDHDSIAHVIGSMTCRTAVLVECMALGERLVSTRQGAPAGGRPATTAELLSATSVALFDRVSAAVGRLPPQPAGGATAAAADDDDDGVFDVAAALLRYLGWRLRADLPLPPERVADVARFAFLPLEVATAQFDHGVRPSSRCLQVALAVAAVALQTPAVRRAIGEAERSGRVCSAIRDVHALLRALLLLPGDSLVPEIGQATPTGRPSEDAAEDGGGLTRACRLASDLVQCLLTHLSPYNLHAAIPQCIAAPLRNLIVGLARLPQVNGFARTPPLAWALGWTPAPSGGGADIPPLPLDWLQEKDVLREFVSRVNLLGWTSRQQFEETWMLLIGVINPAALTDEQQENPEEDAHRSHCAVLATRGLTALLLQTGQVPHAGDPTTSVPEHTSRHRALPFLRTRVGQQLSGVRGLVEEELVALCRQRPDRHLPGTSADVIEESLFCGNTERVLGHDRYDVGQLSVVSTWLHIERLNAPQPIMPLPVVLTPSPVTSSPVALARDVVSRPAVRRETAACGVDLHSCLQFILELYGQLLSPLACPRTPLMQLNDTVKSVVLLSDLFTESSQFYWMLGTLLELMQTHATEDELMAQYLVIGVCKAAAVIELEVDAVDRVTRAIDASLRSPHLPTKVAGLVGSLYVLEEFACDLARQVAPLVANHLLRTLGSISQPAVQDRRHLLVMWAVAFFIIEKCQTEVADLPEFTTKIVQMAVSMASQPEDVVPISVYLAILRGLERLLLAGALCQRDAETLIKLSVDRLCMPNPQRALAALGVMLTCMYYGKENDQWSPTQALQQPEFPADGATSPDPESLILAMERVTLLFDRIRKGFAYEARVIARVLPAFLADFFPPENIMNKVISELLSSQQPHPQVMATVVFQTVIQFIELFLVDMVMVFEGLLRSGQRALVTDWVMLSLSNFTQRTPVCMAIWSLTCFFISAADSPWLRALLPYAVGRMGQLTAADRWLFLRVARHFYARLTDDVRRREFTATFRSVATSDLAYADLVTLVTASSSR